MEPTLIQSTTPPRKSSGAARRFAGVLGLAFTVLLAACGSDSSDDKKSSGGDPEFVFPVGGTSVTLSSSGSNLSGDESTVKDFTFTIPAGATSLAVKLTGGTGDLDVVVFDPDENQAGSSGNIGNEEKVWIANPAAGEWEIDLWAWEDYSGATLTVTINVETPSAGNDVSQLAGIYTWEETDDEAGFEYAYTLTLEDDGSYTIDGEATDLDLNDGDDSFTISFSGTMTWNAATGRLVEIDENNGVTSYTVTKTATGLRVVQDGVTIEITKQVS